MIYPIPNNGDFSVKNTSFWVGVVKIFSASKKIQPLQEKSNSDII